MRARVWTAAALIVLAVGPAAAAGSRCPVEEQNGGLKSPRSSQPATIVFVNRMPGAIELHWIDFNGSRKYYATLKSGQTIRQNTYVGHVWVVTDDEQNYLQLIDGAPGAQTMEITP